MFSNRSKETPQAPPLPVAPPLSAQKQRPTRTAITQSVISADLVVNGSLTSPGDIQIEGRVEGNVRSAGLVIGDQATITGDVFAEDLTVRGRIEGCIHARKVLLCSTCHVEGNILHEAFAVEAGAFFEGNCRHSDDPLAEPIAPRSSGSEYAGRTTAGPGFPLNGATPSNAPLPAKTAGTTGPTPQKA